MARWPKYVPTEEHRRQVLLMVGLGIPHTDIAKIIDCDEKTLRAHFRREIDTGVTEANMRVGLSLYNNAVKHNNVTAQIWWTKCRMGWKGIYETEDGAPESLTMLHLIAARQIAEQMQALLATGTKPNGHTNGNGTKPNGNGHDTIDGTAVDFTKPALE